MRSERGEGWGGERGMVVGVLEVGVTPTHAHHNQQHPSPTASPTITLCKRCIFWNVCQTKVNLNIAHAL